MNQKNKLGMELEKEFAQLIQKRTEYEENVGEKAKIIDRGLSTGCKPIIVDDMAPLISVEQLERTKQVLTNCNIAETLKPMDWSEEIKDLKMIRSIVSSSEYKLYQNL